MAYNSSKGPRGLGDINFEGDPSETQIDFENDFIALKTNGLHRFIVSGSFITSSLPMAVVGAISGSNILRLGTSLSASGDVAITGAVHAASFYGGSSTFGAVTAASLDIDSGGITQAGSIAGVSGLTATGDLDIGAHDLRAKSFTSDVTTGTAPLVVSSTTLVSNLNAEKLNGYDWASPNNLGTTAPASVFATHFSASGPLQAVAATTLGATLTVSGATTIGGILSGSGLWRAGASISGSGDVAVTGAVHAANFYGDGSGLTNVPVPTTLSGTTAELTTGVETSGYLMVSGSSTLGATTITGTGSFSTIVATGSISGSGTIEVAGATTLVSTLNVSGATTFADKVGIGVAVPKVGLDSHYDPGLLVNDTGGGDVGKFGIGSTTAGKLYYLHSGSSNWLEVNAASPQSGSNQMIAIALGATPATHGMLLRGFFDFHTYLTGTFIAGAAVYVADSGGRISTYQPSGSGNVVRIAGHATNTGNVIYFNPSRDWIEV